MKAQPHLPQGHFGYLNHHGKPGKICAVYGQSFIFHDTSYIASIALLKLGSLTVTCGLLGFLPLFFGPLYIALSESTRLYKGGMCKGIVEILGDGASNLTVLKLLTALCREKKKKRKERKLFVAVSPVKQDQVIPTGVMASVIASEIYKANTFY